ncbi:portal protein [Mycobacterium phage LittleLaf]|uniref:Portal protein n=14 Tax=Marvinvirus TaxID=1982091 RepID=A0A3S9U960_9CAUD|nr:portal protein [Mycobacterium phage MosMoris]YP_009614152.1 portal protein [Mycobacterium phage Marvin]ANM46258.1 portal protein [Mycobacterium phage Gattaca]AVE00781.1 portal protein [Mycobacterium phage Tesla]AYB69842.1 portal protein [Mycobacterium phage LittleLaf]AYB70672.1 portal protein [Mycobacterium phage VasuNzinga]AZF93304.1 portal protein [Mycobacterium phage Beelzebub]AZS06800.1 portal protein [Mycobacterium phage Raela]QAX93087.1 portal protein [Mycobacterium phage RedRaider
MTTSTAPFYNPEISYFGFGPDDHIGFASSLDERFVTEDEMRLLKALRSKLTTVVPKNKIKQGYYEAKQVIKHLDIAVPRVLTDIGTALGWGGTVVDVLDERIDWLGWTIDDDQLNGLDIAFDYNNLSVESGFAHVDALTTGCAMVTVGNDDDGENQLIVVESSSTATVLWDYRKRRSIAGLSQTYDENSNLVMETLYLENANIEFVRDPNTHMMEVVNRDQHNIGRCFMTRIANRARPFQRDGRSEITRTVRYLTDHAVRTVLGMEVNREFYTAPQRFVLNADPADFGVKEDMSPTEKFARGLSIAMGMVNIVPGREDTTEGDPVSVHEFKPQPPTPYIEELKACASMISTETGIPTSYLGFVTENPPSADSIRQEEFRLVKRSMRRHGGFGLGWKEVALLTLLARDGDADTDFIRRLKCRFADPYTPTRAATADELTKMIQVGLLVPDSTVAYERYGLDETEQRRLARDKQAFEAKKLREEMQRQAMAAAQVARQENRGGSNAGNQAQKKPPTDANGSAQ